jgi:hypothetical protein
MAADKALADFKATVEERNLAFGEVDDMFLLLRDRFRATEQINADQVKMIENLEEELTGIKKVRD